jgi:hypothetical protein
MVLGAVGAPQHSTPLLLKRVVAIIKTKTTSTSFYPQVEDERVDFRVSAKYVQLLVLRNPRCKNFKHCIEEYPVN